jgi:hypothetical protein
MSLLEASLRYRLPILNYLVDKGGEIGRFVWPFRVVHRRLLLKRLRCLPLKVMRVGEWRVDKSTRRRSTTLRTAHVFCFGGSRSYKACAG